MVRTYKRKILLPSYSKEDLNMALENVNFLNDIIEGCKAS